MRLSSITNYKRIIATSGIIAGSALAGFSQVKPLSIREALSQVQAQQPQLQAARERAVAAGYNTNLARNTLVPDVTAGYQAGYATFNNITGMSYPGLFMPISGPPVASNSSDVVPGTVLTALVKWSPLTFGQRAAAVDKAAAQYKLANAEYNDAVFRQQYAVLSVYLDLVYLNRLLASLQANTVRARSELQQSLSLAKEGLRPGVDTIQFQAALAQSEIDVLTTQRMLAVQTVELGRLMARPDAPEDIVLSDTLLAISTPRDSDTSLSVTDNPRYLWYKAKEVVSASSLKEVQRSWRPHLDVWANVYGRGSGVLSDGTVSKAEGWKLTHDNYGAGLQLSFPILQFSRTSLLKKQYRSFLSADAAQLAQVTLDLGKQMETARRNYRQSRLIAERIPTVTHAQQLAYQGLQLSYNSGLIDYTRLEQARYGLLQAEMAQAGAYIQVWRSLLDIAVAAGRLSLFTDQVSQP